MATFLGMKTNLDPLVPPTALSNEALAGVKADLSLPADTAGMLAALEAGLNGLGTASASDVPVSGDASASEVVKGDDTRLSDSRTPTAHNHSTSEVTGLTAGIQTAVDAMRDTLLGGVGPAFDTLKELADAQADDQTAMAALVASVANRVRYDAAQVLTGPQKTQALANIGAAADTHTHDYSELTNLPTLGTAAALNVGAAGDAAAGEVVKGDDTRLSDARTPTAHDHSYASLAGTPTLGTAAALNVAAAGNAASGEVVKGDDTRLSNARTPTAHTHASSDVTDLTATIQTAVDTMRDQLLGGVGPAFDTLKELADAQGADETAITALAAAVGGSVRYDSVQTLTAPQQAQARTNIGAVAVADLPAPPTVHPRDYSVSCSDLVTPIVAANGVFTGFWPVTGTLNDLWIGLVTQQAGGAIFTVDVRLNGVSILSTPLTIDNTESTSLGAAVPAVISNVEIVKGARLTVDVTQVGDGTAKGLELHFAIA